MKEKFNDTELLKRIFLSIYSEEKGNIEEGLHLLRKNNASQVECIRVLKDILKKTLGECDAIVLYSKTWADQREITEKFREAIYEAWQESGGDEIIEL